MFLSSSTFGELQDEILTLWHMYRTPILLCALTILFSLRIILHTCWNEKEPLHSPTPRSPARLTDSKTPRLLNSASAEKAGDFEERETLSPKRSTRAAPKRVTGIKHIKASTRQQDSRDGKAKKLQPLIFFASLGGRTEAAASLLVEDLKIWSSTLDPTTRSRLLEPQLYDLSYVELDDFFIKPPSSNCSIRYFYTVLLPTYNIDTIINNFLEHLHETHNDFRIDTAPLAEIAGYSVFGFGNREGWPTEEEGFCSQAKEVDKRLAKLTGRKRAFPLGMGDVKSDVEERLNEWRQGVQEVMVEILAGRGLGEGVPGSGDAVESDEEGEDGEIVGGEQEPTSRPSRKPKSKKSNGIDDLEDLGQMIDPSELSPGPTPIDFTTYSKSSATLRPQAPKEMVPKSSPTHAALTKQGYTIIGSHSGVKICRWTKSALRGRGSCYKYSFYGIQSHLCMETTPSLSCSNKCVFCWRHGTNPVGTTWRWVVDPPDLIFEGVKAAHYKKIKMMKGVPGVRANRFQEAMRIRHCALSLVGEPIFYPHINEFVALLHKDQISTFLVCNAQHPEQLAALKHVTQLYVSIDASNKEALRKIDRPLHRDFWERFTRCLDLLSEKRFQQRTVFRLTLVKGFNIDEEATGYADLIERALPCFVEIKGVTYCGTSTSSSAGLTMKNVPFYEEVCDFVRALDTELERRGLGYGIAAEHAHSCCVLIASERFKIDGRWCTRIDYDKFFECLESGKEFGPEDYVGEPTPEWALWGNGGFDPRDTRVDRKGRVIGEVGSMYSN